MELDFVIPAKYSSMRVPHKNWREFHAGKCLVEILIDKLRAAGAGSIYVSCEEHADVAAMCRRLDVQQLVRDPQMSDNAYPLTRWMRGICSEVPGDRDIAWCQVCDPLFNDYQKCINLWQSVIDRSVYDSLVVCYPWVGYLLTATHQPVGWAFGEHHTPSQQLPSWSVMPFTLSLLTRRAVADTGYHVGRSPFWFTAGNPHIDIDNPADFEAAAVLYAHYNTAGLTYG